MAVEIVDYVKPVKTRAANPYDEVVSAVMQSEGEKAVKLSEDTPKDFRRELRSLREAAAFAGLRLRSLNSPVADATEGVFLLREKSAKPVAVDAE